MPLQLQFNEGFAILSAFLVMSTQYYECWPVQFWQLGTHEKKFAYIFHLSKEVDNFAELHFAVLWHRELEYGHLSVEGDSF